MPVSLGLKLQVTRELELCLNHRRLQLLGQSSMWMDRPVNIPPWQKYHLPRLVGLEHAWTSKLCGRPQSW